MQISNGNLETTPPSRSTWHWQRGRSRAQASAADRQFTGLARAFRVEIQTLDLQRDRDAAGKRFVASKNFSFPHAISQATSQLHPLR